jgi:TPP-dependent pyruvate/acetoin dehydrogenase alpha subunit
MFIAARRLSSLSNWHFVANAGGINNLRLLRYLSSNVSPIYNDDIDSNDDVDATSALVSNNGISSPRSSPSELIFTGNTSIPVTSVLHIITPEEDTPQGIWPIFRIMDEDGTFRDGSNDGYEYRHDTKTAENASLSKNLGDDVHVHLSSLRERLRELYPNHALEIEHSRILIPSKFQYTDTESKDTLKRVHQQMIRLREMDTIFQNSQRQGRFSFYMTCRGEEAIPFGAATALEPQDVVLAQYREQGVLMWRGFSLQQFSDQCYSNESDLGKGRQMPVHYGSRALNYQTISSCLGTQIPQAVGVAYSLKLSAANAATDEERETKKAVSICFFGEGCSSTNDFHSGLNLSATLKCPVIFFCRNNGYAISTSVKEQYAGDGVISRAPGYGMAAIRVDGNDVFAVHAAVREARIYALENNAPVLIEAMSYRCGHHR